MQINADFEFDFDYSFELCKEPKDADHRYMYIKNKRKKVNALQCKALEGLLRAKNKKKKTKK